MTIDPAPESQPQPQPIITDGGKTLALVIYLLSLAGLVTGGLTSLVALIIGFIKRDEVRGTIYESHFDFVNATNLWGLLIGIAVTVIGTVLLIVLIGFLILPVGLGLLLIWYLARLIVGLLKLLEGKPYPTPRSALL